MSMAYLSGRTFRFNGRLFNESIGIEQIHQLSWHFFMLSSTIGHLFLQIDLNLCCTFCFDRFLGCRCRHGCGFWCWCWIWCGFWRRCSLRGRWCFRFIVFATIKLLNDFHDAGCRSFDVISLGVCLEIGQNVRNFLFNFSFGRFGWFQLLGDDQMTSTVRFRMPLIHWSWCGHMVRSVLRLCVLGAVCMIGPALTRHDGCNQIT